MDLEKVTAKIRPRQGWEAIDLGVTLVQNHAITLYKIWFAASLPIYIVLMLIMNASPEWMIVVFWWLKPIMERPLLHFFSRELFGEGLNAKQCIKAFYSVAKIQWFASLTWRRFSFTRSLDLPLIQLEGLKGAARGKRLRIIHSADSGNAVWLTIVFVLVETIMYLSVLTLIYLLVPEIYLENLDLWKWMIGDSESFFATQALNFLMYLAISFVAPFYVACGFALYLNQRTHLEAWDIELAFKRLAGKLSEKSSNFNIRLASYAPIGFLLLMTFVFNPPKVMAEESEVVVISQQEIEQSTSQTVGELLKDIEDKKVAAELPTEEKKIDLNNLSHSEVKTMIKKIKDGSDFHQKEIRETNRYRRSEDNAGDSDLQFSPGWIIFAKFFAILVEFALWIFIAVLVLFLILKYKHLLVKGLPNKKVAKKRPAKLFGLDLNTESLPDKPWLVAKQLIEKQQYREALSLLYRASLIWYIDNSDTLIKEGYTELECLRQISKHVGKVKRQYLSSLTTSWRSLAYAHQLPDEQHLIDLCDNWPKVLKQSDVEASNDLASNDLAVKQSKITNKKVNNEK